MDQQVVSQTPQSKRYSGAAGNAIAADVFPGSQERPVLLVHGGGQTRHAWNGTARRLSDNGWTAVTMDQRGHGDSDWISSGDYAFEAFAADLSCVADQVAQDCGRRPVAIGASLGGLAGLLAQGESERRIFGALVLVDITPTVDQSGVEKILGFMSQHMEDGFATLDDAADVIGEYLPNRRRPKDLKGLKKNLRLGEDGRYRWHWDPNFLRDRFRIQEENGGVEERRIEAAKALTLPVLLVRGRQSELVSEHHVREFMTMVPHAEYVDVSEAGHMVAGDRNDAFSDAVSEFLGRL